VRSVIGIDVSRDGIEFAKKHYAGRNLEFVRMDALQLGFPHNSFDAVVSFDVLEHIDEGSQELFLYEISRILRDTGTAYISCPNATVSKGGHGNPFHKRELTKSEFTKILEKYFDNVQLLGQDIIVDGVSQGHLTAELDNFDPRTCQLSYENFKIVKDVSDSTFGLLAICRRRRHVETVGVIKNEEVFPA
jgi:ubiquinone/menaquinone biosynthesis C-methylase UbiE